MCGEHVNAALEAANMSGSSPRVRGTQEEESQEQQQEADHPRVCGEHNHVNTSYAKIAG